MRSNGLATIMLMIPVLAVPALAVFGIPQFAHVDASTPDDPSIIDREPRFGKADRDEFFDDLDDVESNTKPSAGTSSISRNLDSTRRGVESRSTNPQTTADWDEDLKPGRDATDLRRSKTRNDFADVDESTTSGNLPRTSKQDDLPQDFRQSPEPKKGRRGKLKDPVRTASTVDADRGGDPSAFANEQELPGSTSSPLDRGSLATRNEIPTGKRGKSSTESTSWKSAIQRLEQFGIHSFRLEPSHERGQYIFICSYSPPDSPKVSYRFEADSDEPLKAIDKVIDQIVEWRRNQ